MKKGYFASALFQNTTVRSIVGGATKQIIGINEALSKGFIYQQCPMLKKNKNS
jgi:hypothetical protein